MSVKILLWKEAVKGEIPANPQCYVLKAESFGIKVAQASETNTLLGSGRGADRKTYGTDTVSGDIPIIWDTDNAPIFMHHAIGAPTAVANATVDAWAATTLYAKGDMVNHSNGTHTLVCRIAGTSGAAEPAITTQLRGDIIGDATATWILMPLLKRYTGERADALESFGVEVADTNGTTAFSRYLGLHINSLPLSVAGGTIGIKSSLGILGMTKEDSDLDATYEEMSAKTGFAESPLESDFYSLDSCTFELNGSTAEVTTGFDMTISNNVTMEDALNNKKVENIGQVVNDGNINLLFDAQVYKDAADHVDQAIKLTFAKANGCKMIVNFPTVAMDKIDKVFETNKNTMLSIPVSAFDTNVEKSITYEVISPLQSY